MIGRWLRRLRSLVRPSDTEAGLDEEIRAHLEMAAEAYLEQGLSPEEAKRSAWRDFGGVDQMKERHREARALVGPRDVLRDLRLSVRALRKRSGYTATVVMTLALGIGAITTVYSVVDGVLLRPLPYEDPSTLVAVGTLQPGAEWLDQASDLQNLTPLSFPSFVQLGERARSFETLAGVIPFEETIEVPGADPESVRIAGVTPGWFEMLDGAPMLGRAFLQEEYVDSPEVVLLSFGTWQSRYAGDPGVVGRPVEVDGGPQGTIVGVLPEAFHPPEAFFGPGEAPEFWLPYWDPDPDSGRERNLYALGRITAGTSLEQARSEAEGIAAQLAAEFPEANQQDFDALGVGVNRLHGQTVGTAARGLRLFLGAAGLLLVLASMNAATLLLARALDRAHEFGVRAALGAGRGRVVRLLLSEALILTSLAGALGILVAYAGVAAFLRYAPPSLPRMDSVAVDARVLAMAGVVSLGAGVLVGLLPALRLARRGPFGQLRRSGRTLAEPSSGLRAVLVSGQMALAVLLLSGAGLLFGSFVGMRGADLGFEAERLYVMGAQIRRGGDLDPDQPWASWDELLIEVQAVPGVESVALASEVPLRRSDWEPRLLMPEDGPEIMRRGIAGYAITPGFLETMGTELRMGRNLESADGPGAERVALVNESFARTQLGGADPIGMLVRWAFQDDFRGRRQLDRLERWSGGADEIPIRIVGVIEDVVQARLTDGPRPAIYVPYKQARAFSPRAMVRTALPPETIMEELRQAARRYNPSRPPLEVDAMSNRLGPEGPTLRFQTLLIGGFALVATLLAATGLYGALAHSVGRRRRELGVRIALGANHAGLLGTVLVEGMRLAGVGLGIGIVATLLGARALRAFLFGIEPHDPVTLLVVAGVMAVVSALACLVPARLATSVDPVAVLKAE